MVTNLVKSFEEKSQESTKRCPTRIDLDGLRTCDYMIEGNSNDQMSDFIINITRLRKKCLYVKQRKFTLLVLKFLLVVFETYPGISWCSAAIVKFKYDIILRFEPLSLSVSLYYISKFGPCLYLVLCSSFAMTLSTFTWRRYKRTRVASSGVTICRNGRLKLKTSYKIYFLKNNVFMRNLRVTTPRKHPSYHAHTMERRKADYDWISLCQSSICTIRESRFSV